ncbi:type II secretion system F family protein [Amycolatopsis echigonensis]|uniref:Type II secretion system F family protein n=1 Tax=Amycolatopsis echigonensis TaxID=2576905 RepID=A0A8E2B7T1_9PSEU|nr:type II secretion system F family protein [Amycolatopsis echigonensis]MBB2505109.1 type II secretion system F family protein [Amycolatopsis echigonensis]
MSELLVALTGLGFAAGLATVLAGFLGTTTDRAARPCHLHRLRFTRRHLAAVGAGGVLWLVSGWPVVGVGGAAAVIFLPWLVSAGRVSAARIARLEAIETWLRRLADLLGPGHIGLTSAIQASVREAPPEIASEVRTLAQRLRFWEFRPALLGFADDLDDRVGDIAVAGLCVAHHYGAGAAELLTTLARQVSDEVRARRTAEVDRSRRRSTARVLLGIWALMFLGFALLGGTTYTGVYNTVGGQAVLAVVLGLVAAAVVWLHRLGVEPKPPRFLREGARP